MTRSAKIDFQKAIICQTCSIALGILLLSLTACGSGGEQGPTISTGSISIKATASLERNPTNSADSTLIEATASLERNPTNSADSTLIEATANLEQDPMFSADSTLIEATANLEQDPMFSTDSTTTGATASFDWNPLQPLAEESPILGYYVHYGKQPPSEPGSCSYEDFTFVTTPNVTVTGLDSDSRYYFAVSTYDGVGKSSCSNEIVIDT